MTLIFVVEDSPSQAALLRHVLLNSGYQAVVFSNGQAALDEILTGRMPDLIISDIEMPIMDGIELCNALKEDVALCDIPVILVTALDNIDGLVNSLNAYANGYITKPYNPQVLLETVQMLLQERLNGATTRVRPDRPVTVKVGQKLVPLYAGLEHLFEFFMIAFNNACVQSRELDAREKKLKETNAALARNIELLSASEERFRSLVAAVPDIVYRIDAEGSFLFVNDAVSYLGYEPSELIGQHFSVLLHPEDAMACDADTVLPQMARRVSSVAPKLFNERRNGERMTVGLRIRVLKKDRSYFMGELKTLSDEAVHVEINSLGMFGVDSRANRRYIGTVGVIRDVTERIRFEQALEQARDEANAARDLAASANRAKSEFLSSMSHELRTPLNSILGFAQLMDDPQSSLNGEEREMLAQIKEGGEHLLRLIGDVLDLSKIESGNAQLDIRATQDIFGIVDSAIKMVMPMAAAKQIQIKNHAAYNLPALLVDRTRFRQVLVNLLSNAVKYNHDKGEIVIKSALRVGKVRFSICDTGIGIDRDKLSLLFQPFQRLGMENSSIEGTGIGLTICKRLTEEMGGDFGVESRLGEGSTFWFELPLAPASVETGAAAGKSEAAALPTITRPIRILYIEDNAANASLMTSILKRHCIGSRVQVTSTAEEGILFARNNRLDIILMDLRLPGMGGIEAKLTLGGYPETRDIPVIAVSAQAMSDVVKRVNDAGFFSYLAKPIDAADVLRQIQKALQNRSA